MIKMKEYRHNLFFVLFKIGFIFVYEYLSETIFKIILQTIYIINFGPFVSPRFELCISMTHLKDRERIMCLDIHQIQTFVTQSYALFHNV